MGVETKQGAYKDLPKKTGMIDSFRGYVSDKLISIGYPAVGQSIFFSSGIVDDFSDNFNANWSSEESYGRMDQIANYSNTTRSMSVRLILIAESSKIAVRNLADMGKLAQFLYPTYEGGVVKDRPLLTVKLLNLIQDNASGGPLLGYITSLNHTFDLKDGVYEDVRAGGEEAGQLYLFPKYLTINFNFIPYHTQRLGFDADGGTPGAFSSFPYSVSQNSAANEASQLDNTLEEQETGTGTPEINDSQAENILKKQNN